MPIAHQIGNCGSGHAAPQGGFGNLLKRHAPGVGDRRLSALFPGPLYAKV